MNTTGNPRMFAVSSIVSRVVPGNGRDDCAVAAKQLVSGRARFAGVRAANDRGTNSAPEDLAFARSPAAIHRSWQLHLQAGGRVVPSCPARCLRPEINMRFDVRQCFHHFITQSVNALRELAGELFIRRAQSEFSPRMDLNPQQLSAWSEIDPAIKECAARELARLGKSRAIFE